MTLVKMGFAAERRTAETFPETATPMPTVAMIPTVQVWYLGFILYFNFYHPGEGDQFVFDTDTVLGQQMEKTLEWLDNADVETTVTCCSENGPQQKTCGGGGPSCKTICGEGKPLLIWPFSLNHNFSFSVTRFHLAFDEFDKTQCSADLFYRNTDIWKLNDVCPKPKTWVPYEPPYSKYQSLPTYVRGKRQTEGNQAECDSTMTTDTGCSTFGASLDVQTCKSSNLYSPEKIVEGRNPTCCLQPNFRDNSIAQGGGGDEGTANFRATKKECCDQYRAQTGGVDALDTLRCNYST